MQKQPRAVAIYARISQDRDGTRLGIERQLKDRHAEADHLGWTVAEEYVHDDIRAHSGKHRPDDQRMLAGIADGRRDAVITWHIDRLHRRPIELEELARTCERACVPNLCTVHGSCDGLLFARLLAAVATNESNNKSRRGRRKTQEVAEKGTPA